MKKPIVLFLLAALVLISCDDGRLYEKEYEHHEEGRVARLTARIKGASSWGNGYTLTLSGFTSDGYVSEISKDITVDADGNASLVLSGIPDDVTKLEVCVINTIRKRIATFYEVPAPATTDTIEVRPDTLLNVGMYATIQQQIFDLQCASCHAGTSWGAHLDLNAGKSHAALVSQPSQMVSGALRVEAGNAASSVLYQALAGTLSQTWRFDHSQIFASDPDGLQVIKDWINGGAEE